MKKQRFRIEKCNAWHQHQNTQILIDKCIYLEGAASRRNNIAINSIVKTLVIIDSFPE